jgi:hypothetical protein
MFKASFMGVATGPSRTAFTRMPCSPNSIAADGDRPQRPHFDDAYAACCGNGRTDEVLTVTTIPNAPWIRRPVVGDQ